MREGLSRPFWLALVVVAFCLPLFIGLGRTDVENDEGIYSYAVDGILDNGNWLNPRSSPSPDLVFLEKPPLKFWIVAAPIRFGLLPRDEFGKRFWDALFGAVAFLYVFALGRRLAGPVCGVVAVMILFVNGGLLFEHGLRGNNMEAPLFLCYCGGVYHVVAWAVSGAGRRRRWHVVAATLYFVLGFMTKFVAALFLPVVAAVALLAFPAQRRFAEDWRIWAGAVALFVALSAPWFIYEHSHEGPLFWNTIFGTHVVTRFTTFLDPTHLHPWNYYYLTLWRDLQHVSAGWLMAAGAVIAAVLALRDRNVPAVAVLAWAALPLALISIGTSKLPHYAYPFLPPFALLVGLAPAWVIRSGHDYIEAAMARVERLFAGGGRWTVALQRLLLVLALAAIAVAAVTFVTGSINWRLGGWQILRNTHVMRPLLVAFIFATLAGRGVAASRLIFPAAVLLLVLPVNAYEDALRRLQVENHPVRSARDCLSEVRNGELRAARPAPGIYAISEQRWFLHSYYYYLHDVGGWERTEAMEPAPLEAALFTPGRQRPVMIDDLDYRAFKAGHQQALQGVTVLPLREVMLLMPGPYAVCGPKPTAATRF